MNEEINKKNETYDEIKKYMKIIQLDIMKLIDKEREDKKNEAEKKGENPDEVDLTREEIDQLISDYVEAYYQDLEFEGLTQKSLESDLAACRVLENFYYHSLPWFERIAKTAADKKSSEDKKAKNIMEQYAIDEEKRKRLEQNEKIFLGYFGRQVDSKTYRRMIDILCEIYANTKKFSLRGIEKRIEAYEADLGIKLNLPRIQEYISYLNYYGFLDYEVNDLNKYLDKIGASDLKIAVRNPLGMKFLYKGKDIKSVEELEKLYNDGKTVQKTYVQDSSIGIIDTFEDEETVKQFFQDQEFLKNVKKKDFKNPEDYYTEKSYRDKQCLADNLSLLQATYGYEYGIRHSMLSNALNVIRFGDFWNEVTTGDEAAIDSISDEQMDRARKRIEKIEDIYKKSGIEETVIDGGSVEDAKKIVLSSIKPSQKASYTKLLKKNGFYTEDKKNNPTLNGDVESIIQDMFNSYKTQDSFFETLEGILVKFSNKDMKVEVIDDKDISEEQREAIGKGKSVILIDTGMFIGPVSIAVNDDVLKTVFGDTLESCKNPQMFLNGYTSLMSLALKPKDDYLVKKAKELYETNPYEPVIAYIAGLPVKSRENLDNSKVLEESLDTSSDPDFDDR